jgi:glutamine amidotransferase
VIALIDYGMGNIHSVKKALELCGAKVLVTNNPKDILSCKKIILPGVGAFDDAMLELEKQGLDIVIRSEIKNKKPLLGICLGMQLLFEKSEEARSKKGLGILKGLVKKFPKGNFKVPHMGWNQIKYNPACPIFKEMPDNPYLYFCHSYYPLPEKKEVSAAQCDYGVDFTAGVWQENVYGVQFHPEKSQGVGLKIIDNFAKLC